MPPGGINFIIINPIYCLQINIACRSLPQSITTLCLITSTFMYIYHLISIDLQSSCSVNSHTLQSLHIRFRSENAYKSIFRNALLGAACCINFLLNYPTRCLDFHSNFDVLVVALYMALDAGGNHKPL